MAMNRRRNLITSPLDWFLSANPVPPPAIPVLAERGGTHLKTPRPVLVVDTREQNPFDFSRFQGWFSGVERRALKLGDYSISGLEDVCVVERKDLSDLVRSFTVERTVFVARLRQMAEYPHCLLVVSAALSQVKSPYPHSRRRYQYGGEVRRDTLPPAAPRPPLNRCGCAGPLISNAC
jgi:hypothetical protein